MLQEEVQVVHEMGATIFSERLAADIRQLTSGDIGQNVGFDVTLATDLTTPARILGITVTFDTAARLDRAQISLQQNGIDFPIWAWNVSVDEVIVIRMDLTGAGVGTEQLCRPLRPLAGNVPSMLFGSLQIQPMPDLIFRGLAAGFGAGTVRATADILTCHATRGGVSSFGLPIPSW